jgi:hypothetical protein
MCLPMRSTPVRVIVSGAETARGLLCLREGKVEMARAHLRRAVQVNRRCQRALRKLRELEGTVSDG